MWLSAPIAIFGCHKKGLVAIGVLDDALDALDGQQLRERLRIHCGWQRLFKDLQHALTTPLALRANRHLFQYCTATSL